MNQSHSMHWKYWLPAFGLVFIEYLFIVVLFVFTKGPLQGWLSSIPLLRKVAYQADFLVWLVLANCAAVMALPLCLWGKSRSFRIARSVWMRSAVVIGLFVLSCFPIGNYLKEGTLFYQSWMWLFTIWMLTLMWLGMGLLYLWERYPNRLASLGVVFQRVHELLQRDTLSRMDSLLVILLSIWTLALSSFFCFAVLQGIPHVQDSIAQWFQAKIFASGRFYADLPPVWDFFERVYLIPDGNRFYSIFPPGHALYLSLGFIVGIPEWMNPISSAFILLLFFYFAKTQFSMYVARLSVLLIVGSPFFILMGSGFMNHPTCLLWIMLSLVCFQQALRRNRRAGFFALGSGLFWGGAVLVRPQTAIAFVVPLMIWGIYSIYPDRKKLLVCVLLFAVGCVPAASFFLVFNENTTGSAFTMGYEKNFRGNPLGLGMQNWEGRRTGIDSNQAVYHTPVRGFSNFLCNLNGMNYLLFGWPVPSTLWAFFLFMPGLRRGLMDYLFLGIILCVGGVYFFFYYQDFCFGPRFLFETIPFWILLSARGIEEMHQWAERKMPDRIPALRGLTYSLLGAFFLCAFSTVWVERIADLSQDYWGTSSTVLRWARERIPEENALLFVQTEEDQMGLYSVLDPRFDRGWVIARHFGDAANQDLIEHYPDWPVYLIRYESAEPPFPGGHVLDVLRSKK